MKQFISGFRKGYRAKVKEEAIKYDMTEKEFHHLNVGCWLIILALFAFVCRKFRR